MRFPAGLILVFVTAKSAVGDSTVLAVLVLLLVFGSKVPLGTAAVAVLAIVPEAEARTVPLMVMVNDEPVGSVAINPLTVLPEMPIEAGHTAPLVAALQDALMPEIELATTSLKLVPFAPLGPAFEINKV